MMPRGGGGVGGAGGRVILASLSSARLPGVGPVTSSHRGGHSHLQLVQKHSPPCLVSRPRGASRAQAAGAHTTGRLLVTAPVAWAHMPFGLEGPKLVRPVPTHRPRLGLAGTQSIETDCLGKTPFPRAQGSHRVLPADPSANLGEARPSAVGLGHRHQLSHVPILQMGILRLREW